MLPDARFDSVWGRISLERWFFRGYRPNSGRTVLVRSFVISIVAYLCSYSMVALLSGFEFWGATGSWPGLDGAAAARLVRSTLPWLGALFAGVYASLYARYASQWSYLANQYNSIKQSEIQGDAAKSRAMYEWKVAFIADAWTLHLARHSTFNFVVFSWLCDPNVAALYASTNSASDLQRELETLARDLKNGVPEFTCSDVNQITTTRSAGPTSVAGASCRTIAT